MKALRVLTACAAVVLALTATPVAAWDHDGPRRSVFPRPADPWHHWGHAHAPHVIVPPPAVVHHRGAFVHHPVWVQGFWSWTGFHWAWLPGHWARR